MPKKEFNLDHQYQLYLQRVKLKESDMHPQQRIQLKQAFMGACGQMLILLRDDVSELSEIEGVKVMEDMIQQVDRYWTDQVRAHKMKGHGGA